MKITRKSHFKTKSRRRWWLAAFLHRVLTYLVLVLLMLASMIEL